MDTGIAQQLEGVVFSGTNMPKLRKDAILSDGSLLLVDFGHSLGRVAAVPGQGSVITNIADDTARRIIGSNASTGLVVEAALADKQCRAELTAKGGIHVISAHTGQTADGYWRAAFNAQLLAYMASNPNHHYFVSLWHRPTRAALEAAAPQSYFHVGSASGTSASSIFHFQGGLPNPVDVANFDLRYASDPNNDSVASVVGKARLGIVAPTSRRGSAAINNGYLGAGSWGAWGSANRNKAASVVLYRAYVEDLTVSGRSADTVAAIDKSLWAAAFAAGGKFYGDTFTDPNSIS